MKIDTLGVKLVERTTRSVALTAGVNARAVTVRAFAQTRYVSWAELGSELATCQSGRTQ